MSDSQPAALASPRLGLGRLIRRAIAGAALLVWVVAIASRPAALDETKPAFGPKYRASGIVHVHTNLSDGRGSPSEVLAAAAEAGADFIVVTDHNRVDPEAFASISDASRPVVILGSEISTEAGHILAIGIRAPTFKFSGTLREVLDDIHHLGGCAFAAHPTSPRGETRFSREEEAGPWGIEVVNGDSAWREASPLRLALAAWTYPANAQFALRSTLGDFGPERALLDRLLSQRFAPIVGGTDAHGRIPVTRTFSVPLPSYRSLFGLVRTVVQLKEPLPAPPAAARAVITNALCRGESVVAIPSFADPKGFSFVARAASGEEFGPGSTMRFSPGVVLEAGGAVPRGTRLRLFGGGRELASGEGSLTVPVSNAGVFRVEAYAGRSTTPWIISNAISVLAEEQERQRSEAARPFSQAYVLGRTRIDDFEGETHFAAEHDPGSRIEEPIIDPSGGRGAGKAARLSFQLNRNPNPPVWCALVDRTPRDLSASKGVAFWLKADGEYRVWFQLRDLNPASADEGTEAWFASVRTSTAWTLYNVPFASLRSINKKTDGSFDPSKVVHMVFVIDHGAMPFGSRGQVWIDDVMGY